jgi:hypothetical protein
MGANHFILRFSKIQIKVCGQRLFFPLILPVPVEIYILKLRMFLLTLNLAKMVAGRSYT